MSAAGPVDLNRGAWAPVEFAPGQVAERNTRAAQVQGTGQRTPVPLGRVTVSLDEGVLPLGMPVGHHTIGFVRRRFTNQAAQGFAPPTPQPSWTLNRPASAPGPASPIPVSGHWLALNFREGYCYDSQRYPEPDIELMVAIGQSRQANGRRNPRRKMAAAYGPNNLSVLGTPASYALGTQILGPTPGTMYTEGPYG